MPSKLTLLGLFILSYLLYRRLFKIRLPKEIIPTQNSVIISIYILLCTSAFIIACVSLYTFIKFCSKKEEPKPITNPLLLKLIELYQSKWNPMPLFYDSLLALDIYIKNKIPRYDENRDYLDVIIMSISEFFCKYERVFLFTFIFIPLFAQSIVMISFFIDIFLNEKFYYFYKNLWLLIFPLITKYILHSIKALIDTNLKSLENVLTLKVVKASDYGQPHACIFEISIQDWKDICDNTPKGFYLCMTNLSAAFLNINPGMDHRDIKRILQYCVESMNEFLFVQTLIDKYAILKKKIILPFNILKYLAFSIGWGYVLYLIL